MSNGTPLHQKLSRRERQIMDVLFKLGRGTANEILAAMPDPPSNSAVRTHLRTLLEKGHVKQEAEDLRYVYRPAVRAAEARRSALEHLVDTFFGGSAGAAAAALLDERSARLSGEDLDRLTEMIERARKDGK
ncbi:MAG: BlaI/MecI/CopY family transcriptional regulator [Bryobacteraceae bacterium]|jgi:predicted transcriptional regulator|nr:BlaI/MecI/CopY family transcriptional regulator [Solibacteraceae bacterium]MCO5351154.1 BlaI/MecI/CopY family transcriptional regulator [Bryobacteraceae bacterium]